MTLAWSKNKKGAALVYAIMVLLLLATVIVALTALSTASYTDAVLSASDDQSYYYAKSIGLAVKEQFKDGYNIARILASLDEQEEDASIEDPKVTGTFTIANKDGDLVTGSLQIRYARDEYDNVNTNVIEVRSACVVNNAVAAVTSVFSCEDDSEDEVDHLEDALTDYDVILTDVDNPNFDFSQASESSGKSNLSVYVYAGEDDNATVPPFTLHVDLSGKLTTTGKVAIYSKAKGSNVDAYHKITGNLTCYGDIGLVYTGVNGSNGIHCDGNVILGVNSYVKNNIYARGAVAIADQPGQLNLSYVSSNADGTGGGLTKQGENADGLHSAKNIYAQGGVSIGKMAWVTGSIYTHGDVVVTGKGASAGNPYGLDPLSDHMGNTLVEGSIYSEGNVTIQSGAIVGGNIYANGNVIIAYGATVVGNVQSLNGNVYVYSSVVGGQVNCPKGVLELNNYGQDYYCSYLMEYDWDPAGRVVFGGIGIYQYGKIYKHTCYTLKTTDCSCMSIINGNIYVEKPTYTNGGTPLLSVWARDGVFLKDSFAYFAQENGLRAYIGKNEAGNPYTYVAELNQNKDLYDPAQQYINMYGAHVITLNVGANKDTLYDAYLWNGWVNNVNARCLILADMQVDTYAYASQYMYVWGTGTNVLNYASTPAYHRDDAKAYTYALSGTNGYTYIPAGPTLEVACKMPSYSGINTEDTRCGFGMGVYSDVRCEVKVGSNEADLVNSVVVLGDEGNSGATKFFGTLHAYVATVWITASTRLSPVKSGNPQGATGRIYAEVDNLFYVEPSTSAGQYRWGSTIQVKGNALVEGWVYNFDHFEGNFSNTETAKFQGTFRTTASGNITLQGSSCFSGEVQATNGDSVFSLSGNLTVTGLRLNGKLKFTSASYKLTVNGNAYIKNMSSQIIAPVAITGNLTIGTSDQSVLKPQKAFSVGGDLYLGQKSLELSATSHVVTGKVEAANGDITVKGGASIGGAKTASTKTLTISGGTLAGDFSVGNFTFTGGTVAPTSDRIKGKVTGIYTHSGGSIKNSDIKVTYSSSSTAAVNISGTAKGESVFINANSGFATVTGGSNVEYKAGALRTYYTTTIQGGFQCGISVSYGSLNIGSSSPTSDVYKVGTIIQSGDQESDSYRIIYAKGNIDWGYGARAPYDGPQMYCDITRVTAGGNVVMGRSDYYVSGMFSGIYSENGYVNLYVEKVDGVYAKNTSWIHTSGFLGGYKNDNGSGAKITNGELYVYGLTGNEYLRGHNEVSGVFHLEQTINAEGCRIKCRDITGLGTFKKSDGCAPISLHLTAPTKGSDGYYELTTGIAGDFTIKNSNLKYNSPVKVKGELYVDGILMYNGSTENVQCLGGLYCKNDKVNITSDFKGNVQLPNVTTLVLNADIGINAPKVTSFELNTSISHSVSLTSCDSITVSSGITVGGSIKIKNTGKVTNNGRIEESVECGIYEGSGSVGGNVVTLKGDSTSTISGAGYVTGNIWASGNLTITSTGTFGKSGSYIYSKKNINITNARFNSGMDYILSTGGYIELTNCKDYVPKVENTSGYIRFKNNSSNRALIKSVLSYGTYIDFGSSDNGSAGDDYQTVTGSLHWSGNYSGNAVDFRGGAHTIIEGATKIVGTGNAALRKGTFSALTLMNTGTASADSAGSISNLWIGSSVTTANIAATITGNVRYNGGTNTEMTLGAVNGNIEGNGGKSLTVTGAIGSYVNARGTTTITLKGNVSSYVITANSSLTTEGTIGSYLRAYDSNLYINGNVGSYVNHTAPAITSSSAFKTVALGNQTKMITVGGDITVHGRLADNSKQTKSSAVIYCKGTYYGDLKKDFTNCATLNYQTEANGNCVIVGSATEDRSINTLINAAGRLFVYTVYNEANNKWYTVTFKKEVRANALVVNTKPAEAMDDNSTGDDETYLMGLPTRKVIKYSKNENTSKAWGKDKHAWMEDLSDTNPKRSCPATWGDIYYDALETATSQQLVVFNKPVYVTIGNNYTGSVHASNTKWASGSTLFSDGQVAMNYCCLYSKGYSSTQKHCDVTGQGGYANTFWDTTRGVLGMDGSMFVHAYDLNGSNYFGHVTTNSNLSIYHGNTYLLDGCVFKGCTENTSKGYSGNTATVLMYFGDSLFIDGGSCIQTARDRDVDIPSGRSIIWVNFGTLYVGQNSYIGYKRYGRETSDDDINTNKNSFHPGVFVSDTGGGSVSYDGTSYEKGTACVRGSVSLDIMAYRNIRIYKNGVVTAKGDAKKEKMYKAGLYCSKGSVLMQKSDGTWTASNKESNPGSPGGWFGYFDATSGRDFYTANDGSGPSDTSVYRPDGAGYVTYLKKEWNGDQLTNIWVYWPLETPSPELYYDPAIMEIENNRNSHIPTGVGTRNMTATAGTLSVTVSGQIDPKPSAPDQPTISATGGFNNNGDASVNPLEVNNISEPDGPCTAMVDERAVNVTKVSAPSTSLSFLGGRANSSTICWTSPNYSPSGTSVTHASSVWTSSITKHFDKTVKDYWNTRYIPYVWKLPYYDSDNAATPAKRVLQAQPQDIEINGHMMLKQTSSTGYYTNQDQYAGSSLASFASKIYGYRSAGVSSGGRLYDVLKINSYPEWDGPFDKDPDHKRRTKILVFESGELSYNTFFMGGGTSSDDYASWNNSGNKKIRGVNQKAWRLGDPDVSFYDGSLVFYTCADPANPYGSAAKDLHVVLPQGIGFDFVVDAENTVTVVGKGRLFLYLTSGDTVVFRAKATNDVYANPVGGLKSNSDGTYSPLMYIIGAGTNIDLYIDRMPVSAFIYMPFGSDGRLYNASSGTLKQYNNFKSLANGSTFSDLYSGTGATTNVGRNSLHLIWDSTSGGARNMCGTFVLDYFDYQASSNCLNFKNYADSARTDRKVVPNFADTTIYSYSTTGSNLRGGKTYPLATFLSNAPGYSTSLLNWEYKRIKVEG